MRILLATDGSETAKAAVEYVAAFPLPPRSEVKIISVIADVLLETQIDTLTPEQWDAFEHTKNGTQVEVEDLLNSGALRLRESGLSVTTEIRTGHPAAEIVAAADDDDVDLIVVGSHGMTGFKRFLLGSVTNQVLQSASSSVLIVRKPEDDCEGSDQQLPAPIDHPWRLLVGYDGSDSADEAIGFCESLNLDDRSSIRLLTVLPMVRLFRQDIRQELNWIWQESKEIEKAALEATAARLRRTSAEVSTELAEAGDVSSAILSEGEEFGADVIILGHKGKGAIEKFLMGSVTPRIADHSCRSVLAVR